MQVTGIILIFVVLGLLFLWIRYTRNQEGVQAKENGGIQVFDILVKGAYSPSVIKAKAGTPIRINFKREESAACSKFVNFSDFKIRKELPEGETIPVEFTPDKKGEFTFTCDMSMYQGKLIVE